MSSGRLTVHSAFWEGVGVHSGAKCRVAVAPGMAGYVLNGVPITPSFIEPSTNSTAVLGVDTVEHLLAALRALEIDDVEIVVEGGEVPWFDGSAEPFTERARPRGGERAGCSRPLRVSQVVEVRLGEGWIRAVPADELSMCVTCDFPWGSEVFDAPVSEAMSAASARSFATLAAFKAQQRAGRGRGATEMETLLYDENLGRWNQPLRFPDEPVRHKWLDLLGDLALFCGRPIVARVEAFKPGHRLNHQLVRALIPEFRKARS